MSGFSFGLQYRLVPLPTISTGVRLQSLRFIFTFTFTIYIKSLSFGLVRLINTYWLSANKIRYFTFVLLLLFALNLEIIMELEIEGNWKELLKRLEKLQGNLKTLRNYIPGRIQSYF